MNKKYDIFISYRRAGGIDSAVALQSLLHRMHYRVFLDVDGLHNGRFDESLLKHIHDCKDFLLVLSPHALDRCSEEGDWVRTEIEYAMSLGKNIVPIICDGGDAAERLQADLPESLTSLPRYQVLQTNLVQLQAMTQLLRSHLTARPHNSTRGFLIGAAAAIIVCIAAFFAAGALRDYLSTFPRTAAEKNYVSQAIALQGNNLMVYNVAQRAYLEVLDDCTQYLSGSPNITRTELSENLYRAMDVISAQTNAVQDADSALISGLQDSPINTADLGAMDDYLLSCLNELYSHLMLLEFHMLDDPYIPMASKTLWISCYQEQAEITAKNMILGINEQFLPVSDEALRPLRTTTLPLLSHLYHGQPWLSSQDEIETQLGLLNQYERDINDRLRSDVSINEATLEYQMQLGVIRDAVSDAEAPAEVRSQYELDRVEKDQFYALHAPLATDSPDELFTKATMFLSRDMPNEALEAFELFSLSGAPNAAAVGYAASQFVMAQRITGVTSGIIVNIYEPNKAPQPGIMIGDVIFSVNGVEITTVDEYTAAKGTNAASEVHLLRFTEAGYERLSVQLDPDAGKLGFRDLVYIEPAPTSFSELLELNR